MVCHCSWASGAIVLSLICCDILLVYQNASLIFYISLTVTASPTSKNFNKSMYGVSLMHMHTAVQYIGVLTL